MKAGLTMRNHIKPLSFLNNIIWLTTVGLLLVSCSSSVKKKVISEKGKDHVFLLYHIEKADGAEKIVPQGYDHPIDFKVEQMDTLLSELKNQDYEFFVWQKPKPVFTKDERDKLAPSLAQAFKKASPDAWIEFVVTGHRGAAFSDYPTFTAGICYIQNGKLNMVFSTIEQEYEIGLAIEYEDNPRGVFKLRNTRLVPLPDKKIEKPPVIQGDQWHSREHENWLTVDVQCFRNRLEEAETETLAEVSDQKDPVTRLKKLKRLHDLKLISDDEFNKKRQEILKQL